jgi:hypothetical protein
MPRKRHYSPQLSRFIVSVLYHEAKTRNLPMTKLTERLLARSLRGSASWQKAEASLIQESSSQYSVNH